MDIVGTTNGQEHRKWGWDVLLLSLVVAVLFLYFVLNIPRSPVHILRTTFDNQIPRIPFFSIPYLAFLPWLFGTILYFWIKNRSFLQLALSVIIVNLIAFGVYMVFQTYIPRDPIISNDFFSGLLRFIYDHDQPYYCFPSLHSALSAVIATYFVCRKSPWAWAAVAMAAIVVVSTLSTKQHFAVDAISGILLGILATLVVFRTFPVILDLRKIPAIPDLLSPPLEKISPELALVEPESGEVSRESRVDDENYIL